MTIIINGQWFQGCKYIIKCLSLSESYRQNGSSLLRGFEIEHIITEIYIKRNDRSADRITVTQNGAGIVNLLRTRKAKENRISIK